MILGVIDHDRGKIDPLSFEMLSLARTLAQELGDSVEAILIGAAAEPLAEQLGAYGVAKAHLVQHNGLDDYAPEAWATSVVLLAESLAPQAICAPGSDRGNELMAHVAATTDQPLAANCSEIQPGDPFLVTRVRWGGSLFEQARLKGDPKLFTVAPNLITAVPAPDNQPVQTEIHTPALADQLFRVQVRERVESAGDKISLAEARVVVGGGRGVGSSEGFAPLDELAGLLGGAVGGSRVVTNLGWRPHTDQIGQTGVRISPDLYIACGVSGAIQHMVGCRGAKYILAINADREAPIISRADYAVIGDLHEVVPALIAAIKEEQAG